MTIALGSMVDAVLAKDIHRRIGVYLEFSELKAHAFRFLDMIYKTPMLELFRAMVKFEGELKTRCAAFHDKLMRRINEVYPYEIDFALLGPLSSDELPEAVLPASHETESS